MASFNLDGPKQDNVDTFIAVTNTPSTFAINLLEACSWNVQVALERYFNNPDISAFEIINAFELSCVV